MNYVEYLNILQLLNLTTQL